MVRVVLAVALLVVLAGMTFSVCDEHCADDDLCVCVHELQAIVEDFRVVAPLPIVRRLTAPRVRAYLPVLPADIFHVPIPG
jgi:hypothetical protein